MLPRFATSSPLHYRARDDATLIVIRRRRPVAAAAAAAALHLPFGWSRIDIMRKMLSAERNSFSRPAGKRAGGDCSRPFQSCLDGWTDGWTRVLNMLCRSAVVRLRIQRCCLPITVSLRTGDLHGNGDNGNTAVMGTTIAGVTVDTVANALYFTGHASDYLLGWCRLLAKSFTLLCIVCI